MKNRRPLRGVLAALMLIVIYFVLAPHPLGKDPVLRPAWSLDLAAARVRPPQPGARLAPFQLDGRFGYVAPDGSLAFLGTTGFRVALSDRGFVSYPRVGTTWLLQDGTGEVLLPFSGNGYPLMSGDGARLFLVRTDLTGMTELSPRGEAVWSRDFPTLMTSVCVAGDWAAVGLLDGTVCLVDRSGGLALERVIGGSRIPVVLGCAVTADGSRVAAVAGIDPQRVSVFERRGDSWVVAAQADLGTDFRREVRIGFAPDGRWLACEGRGGAAVLDVASGSLAVAPMRGALAGILFQPSASRQPAAPGGCVLVSRIGAALDLAVVLPSWGPSFGGAPAVLHRETIPLADAAQPGPWLGAVPGEEAGGHFILAAANRVTGFSLEGR